jgi:type VI secretion system secreted protein VgrG
MILARSVFGDAIDYSQVRIYHEKYFLPQDSDNVMTPNGNMYYHPQSPDYRPDFSTLDNSVDAQNLQILFIHEMTHVWQYQQGRNVLFFAGLVQIRHQPSRILKEKLGILLYDGYAYTLKPNTRLEDYNLEQQGDIVADWFALTNKLNVATGSCKNKPPAKAGDYDKIVPFKPITGIRYDTSPAQLEEFKGLA